MFTRQCSTFLFLSLLFVLAGLARGEDYLKLQKDAENGNAEAQFILGKWYHAGQGFPQDDVKSFMWYCEAAKQGLAKAQNNVGAAYSDGKGMARDEAEAAKWFRKASDQGMPVAQYNLALQYHSGQGVKKDFAAAIMWYRKAAEQGTCEGTSNACYSIQSW